MMTIPTKLTAFAYSAFGVEFTQWFVAGTPGAERSLQAFFPGV